MDDPRFDFEVALELASDGAAATRATYRASIALHGRWRPLDPFLALGGASGVRGELDRLRARVEASPGTAAA